MEDFSPEERRVLNKVVLLLRKEGLKMTDDERLVGKGVDMSLNDLTTIIWDELNQD